MKYVELLAHKKPGLHILEARAGSGDATRANPLTLARNGRNDWPYYRTGRAGDALSVAEDSQSSWKCLINFKKLDIKAHVRSQGFQIGY